MSEDENTKLVARFFRGIQKPDEVIASVKQRGAWDLLNDRMRSYLEFLAGLKDDFPIESVRGSRNDDHLNTSFYVMGVTDKYYRTSISSNINYDPFFDNKEIKDHPSMGIGDLIIIGESKDERICHRHHRSEIPNLLIAHSAVYIGDVDGTQLYFGRQWGNPVTGVFDFDKLLYLCNDAKPEHLRQFRVYDKSLFESEQNKKQLTKLLLKEDKTYFGD
jgi:hypothetical protein